MLWTLMPTLIPTPEAIEPLIPGRKSPEQFVDLFRKHNVEPFFSAWLTSWIFDASKDCGCVTAVLAIDGCRSRERVSQVIHPNSFAFHDATCRALAELARLPGEYMIGLSLGYSSDRPDHEDDSPLMLAGKADGRAVRAIVLHERATQQSTNS